EIVMALQAMVTRRFDAAEAVVVTITQLDAGSAHNIVPDHAHLKGTMRTLTPERRVAVQADVRRLAQNIAAAHDCTAEVTITEGFPPTINDTGAVALAEQVAHDLGGAFLRL